MERWVGMEEMAEHLGISVVSLRRLVKEKKLPAHRMGKLWKFKVSEVDAEIKTKTKNP